MAEKTPSNIHPTAKGFYDKALAALERNNLDYAIEMFIQCLNVEPNFAQARQYLRATQMKKTESAGRLGRMFTAAKLTPLLTKAKVSLQRNPKEAMTLAEQALSEDPKNGQALSLLAEAAEVAGFAETVVQTLETYTRLNPKDVKGLHWLARAYTAAGQHEQARETYERILQINPSDFDAQKKLKDATAHGAMAGGGWEEATSFRDALKDEKESVALEQESRVVRAEDMVENLIKEKLQALAGDPDNPVIQRELGKLYAQKENFDEALRYLEALYTKEGGADPSLEREIADVKVKRLETFINAKKKQMETNPANAAALGNEISTLQTELDQVKLADAERLVERYPNDLMYRYELGVLYLKAGNVQGAIEQFQKSRGQPQRRVASLNYLGQCFQQIGFHDMAVDVFNEAINEIPTMDGLKKDLLYNLGCAYESMGQPEKAVAEFKKIAAVDFGFRDVRDKIMRKPAPKQP
ncbi:MAG TPA: tetratricopeptide repeat protein [Verrucomicrobiae bacterium]|nr:tetratricopeptide repeat protein [Verrucomicrobiae bacterium]